MTVVANPLLDDTGRICPFISNRCFILSPFILQNRYMRLKPDAVTVVMVRAQQDLLAGCKIRSQLLWNLPDREHALMQESMNVAGRCLKQDRFRPSVGWVKKLNGWQILLVFREIRAHPARVIGNMCHVKTPSFRTAQSQFRIKGFKMS